ncbi:MAG: alpha/beta hydrolase fold domain-containing protein [Verrucomicrobiota bacterium]
MKSPPTSLRHVFLCCSIFVTPIFAQDSEKSEATPARVTTWIQQMDKNSDGKLAEAETSGLMKQFFGRNDTNKDGFLDVAELTAVSRILATRDRRGQQNQRSVMNTKKLLADAPADVKVIPDIAYRKGESEAWKLDLIMPKAESEEPRPGIIFVHGGGWRGGDKRAGTFLNGAIEYAQKGYVCITVNYRLVDEAPLPACIEDVKCAVRWFRANAEKYNVNPQKIGAFGNSAGAHLVCMLGLTGKGTGLEGDGPYQDQSSLVQAVCASATPTDFNLFRNVRQASGRSSLFGDADGEARDKLIAKTSPITHVSSDAPPILLFHGTKDNTVDVKHSDSFVAALKDAGAKDVTYLRIEGAGHGVFNQHKDECGPAMEAFFARVLKEGEAKKDEEKPQG